MSENDDFDPVIIGGGPAGVTCAIWLRQFGMNPIIVEKRPSVGGLQNDSPYPNTWIGGVVGLTGVEFARALGQQVSDLGIEVRTGTAVEGIDKDAGRFAIALAGTERLFCDSVVLASGVRPRTGGIEPGPEVIVGPGHGVESAGFAGCRVAILGGGDNAFENYAFISAAGARSVTIFARSVRARRSLVAAVPAGDVHIGPYEVDAAARSVRSNARTRTFDKLAVFYGWQPNAEAVGRLAPERDADGFVKTDLRTTETSVPGLFAIGEVAGRFHPCCATSMADGVVAATEIRKRREAESG